MFLNLTAGLLISKVARTVNLFLEETMHHKKTRINSQLKLERDSYKIQHASFMNVLLSLSSIGKISRNIKPQ